MHDAVAVRLEPRDSETFALELLQWIEHRLVLGARRDDVLASVRVEARDAEDCEVVGFRSTGSPDDALGPRADRGGNLNARFLDDRACAAPVLVARRRRV